MKTKQSLLLALSLLVLSTSLSANYALNDSYNIRQKALGGTQVATFKSISSFHQNPAFLSLQNKSAFSLPKLEIGFNENIFDKFQELSDLAGEGDDESDQIAKLKELTPFKFGAKANINPFITVVKGGLGFTMFSEFETAGNLKRKSSPQLEVSTYAQSNVMLGYAKEFDVAGKPLHVGIAPKYIHKIIAYDTSTGEDYFLLTQSEILHIINNDTEIDVVDTYVLDGTGIDVGFLRPIGNGYYGLTVKNLRSDIRGTKELDDDETKNVIQAIPPLWTLGTSFDYKAPIIGKTNISADYNVISETTNFYKKLHIGIEKPIKNFLFLRGGLNQGFIVGGFGVNFFYFKLDYAYFAEELGLKLGQDSLMTHNFQMSFTF